MSKGSLYIFPVFIYGVLSSSERKPSQNSDTGSKSEAKVDEVSSQKQKIETRKVGKSVVYSFFILLFSRLYLQQGLAVNFIAWSPILPPPPSLELHPEEHLVKAELRQRSKAALVVQVLSEIVFHCTLSA